MNFVSKLMKLSSKTMKFALIKYEGIVMEWSSHFDLSVRSDDLAGRALRKSQVKCTKNDGFKSDK